MPACYGLWSVRKEALETRCPSGLKMRIEDDGGSLFHRYGDGDGGGGEDDGDDGGRGLLTQDRLEDEDADDRRDEDDMRNSGGFGDVGSSDSGDVDEDAGDVDDRFSGSTSSTAFSY